MKKALIVLLILAVAGGLFAQSIDWNGSVQTGVKFTFTGDVPVKGDDDDSNEAVEASLGATYDAGDWGLKIKGGTNTAKAYRFDLGNVYGWTYFADHLFKVSAGLIDDGVWSTFGRYDTGLASGTGVRLEIMPIAGLNFGAFFTYPTGTTSALKIGDFLQSTAIGAEYAADAFKVSTTFKLYSEADTEAYGKMDAYWIFSVGLYALPVVDFIFDGGIKNLMTMSDNGVETLAEKFVFKGLPVGLTLGLTENFVKSFEFAGLDAELNLDYAMDPLTIGADASLGFDKDFGMDTWGFDAWAKYTVGGSWLKGKFGVTGGDGVDATPYLHLTFGYAW